MKNKRFLSLIMALLTVFCLCGTVATTQANALDISPFNISIRTLRCDESIVYGRVESHIYVQYANASKLSVKVEVEQSADDSNFSIFNTTEETTTSKVYSETKRVSAVKGYYYRTTVTATTYDANNNVVETKQVRSGSVYY